MRSSSFNAFENCGLRYYLEYILGYPNQVNIKTECGSVVHKALELTALSALARKEEKSEFYEEEIGDNFMVGDHDTYIISSYNYYSSKSENEWTKAELNNCKKWFQIVLDSPYNPENLDIVSPEQRFNVVIDKDWAKYDYGHAQGNLALMGSIDLVYRKDGMIHLYDTKTGQRKDWFKDKVKEYDDLATDPQLLLYYYAACCLYGKQDMITTIFFVRDGGDYSFAFGSKEYDMAEEILRERFLEIKKTDRPKRLKESLKRYSNYYGRQYDKCKWCLFSEQMTIWDNDKKEWVTIPTNLCDYLHGEIKKRSTEEIRVLHGIEGAYSKYGDGGGKSSV